MAKRDIEVLPADKIELGRQSERQVIFLESSELERLLKAPVTASGGVPPKAGMGTFKSLRDKAILELLFSTGLRVSELCGLNRDSINLKSGEFAVRGKGDKVRLVFLSAIAKEALKNYLEKREDVDEALFIRPPLLKHNASRQIKNASRVGDKKSSDSSDLRLTTRSIERLVKHYAAKAGLSKKVTPHTLRHSFATDLLINGADIRSVQELLGHSNITTTQIYTHITDKQLREVHEAFHGKRRK